MSKKKNKKIKTISKPKENARAKMIGQHIGYRYDVNLLPDYKKLGKSLSQIVNNFSDTPAIIEGELNISNGKIQTTDLHVKNNNNRINLKGSYDIPSDFFDAQIFFFETEELIVEAIISGSLKNPSIQIINENNLIDDTQINNDLKKVFEDGINTLIDKLLNLNE